MSAEFRIVSINVGTPRTLTHDGRKWVSGISKQPVERPLYLSFLNFEGDGQADLVHHGGRDKAVCVYSHDHYPYWEGVLGRPLPSAAFGENLTVAGLTERDVCIGDVFQLGEAVVQVSQPRQPCHKLAKRYGVPDLPLQVQTTGYTGFYLRVLTEGRVTKAGPFRLLQRHPAGVTVDDANRIMHRDKRDRDGIRWLLDVAELSDSWRAALTKRLHGENEAAAGPSARP